jgi:glucan phosphoethanolaminetransferase (alkaline phosphatase superfamily)
LDGKGRDEKVLAPTMLVCIGEVQWVSEGGWVIHLEQKRWSQALLRPYLSLWLKLWGWFVISLASQPGDSRSDMLAMILALSKLVLCLVCMEYSILVIPKNQSHILNFGHNNLRILNLPSHWVVSEVKQMRQSINSSCSFGSDGD